MGGVLILAALSVSVLLFGNLSNPYVIIMFIATLQYGIIGFIDDYLKVVKKDTRGLAARFKLLMQFVTSASVVAALVISPMRNLELTKVFLPFSRTSPLIWTGLLPLCDAAFDGGVQCRQPDRRAGRAGDRAHDLCRDRLCRDCLSLRTFTMANYLKIPYIDGAAELAVFGGALVGGGRVSLVQRPPCPGVHGRYRSLSLGGALGIFALMLKKELLLLIIGGVFVVEALSVIIQVSVYKWKKVRVFRMAPIHLISSLKAGTRTR
jgi:phospho-N-acetylmuramoyl-pentapeptide-transferase